MTAETTEVALWQRVRGRSMEPALREGDDVLVAPAAVPVRVGEVVVARVAAGRLVLHRVVALPSGHRDAR